MPLDFNPFESLDATANPTDALHKVSNLHHDVFEQWKGYCQKIPKPDSALPQSLDFDSDDIFGNDIFTNLKDGSLLNKKADRDTVQAEAPNRSNQALEEDDSSDSNYMSDPEDHMTDPEDADYVSDPEDHMSDPEDSDWLSNPEEADWYSSSDGANGTSGTSETEHNGTEQTPAQSPEPAPEEEPAANSGVIMPHNGTSESGSDPEGRTYVTPRQQAYYKDKQQAKDEENNPPAKSFEQSLADDLADEFRPLVGYAGQLLDGSFIDESTKRDREPLESLLSQLL
jgi:hypothetical protein